MSTAPCRRPPRPLFGWSERNSCRLLSMLLLFHPGKPPRSPIGEDEGRGRRRTVCRDNALSRYSAWVAMPRPRPGKESCTDASGRVTVLFGNSAQEWPERSSAQGSTSGHALGAENTMNIERARVLAMARHILAFRTLKHCLLSCRTCI
jgi:hypothetical protein